MAELLHGALAGGRPAHPGVDFGHLGELAADS